MTEELKNTTGQELIEQRDSCGVDSYYSDYLDSINAEMLKRFNRLTELEKKNEELKQQVSYLEDNLRVARKDRETLQDAVANGLEDFIKEKPHTSLRFLANKELKEENEHIRQLLGTAIIVLNRIENPEVPYEKVVDNLRKLKELLGSVE